MATVEATHGDAQPAPGAAGGSKPGETGRAPTLAPGLVTKTERGIAGRAGAGHKRGEPRRYLGRGTSPRGDLRLPWVYDFGVALAKCYVPHGHACAI